MSKLDLLSSLLAQTSPILHEQFALVADYVSNCIQGKRNIIAHGMWVAGGDDQDRQTIVKFRAKGRLVETGGSISKGELEGLALAIAEITVWLMQLGNLLPKLRLRRGGLGHKTPEIQNPQGCATRRMLALQPLTRSQKVLGARKPPPKQKNQKPQK